jgi:diguanylate cyclase (GGDEF)-like protein/PAS domain S-box-containing protein
MPQSAAIALGSSLRRRLPRRRGYLEPEPSDAAASATANEESWTRIEPGPSISGTDPPLQPVLGLPVPWIRRLRRGCLLLSLNAIGILAVLLLGDGQTSDERSATLLALAWLACRWIAEYRHPTRALWWDVADGGALVLAGLAIDALPFPGNVAYLSMLYASLSFRSLSLTGRRVIAGVLVYFATYLTVLSLSDWTAVTLQPAAVGYEHLPALILLAAAAHLLAVTLTRREDEVVRHEVLVFAATRLATAPGQTSVEAIVREAAQLLTPPGSIEALTLALGSGPAVTRLADEGTGDGAPTASQQAITLPRATRRCLDAGEVAVLDGEAARAFVQQNAGTPTGWIVTLVPLRDQQARDGVIVVQSAHPLDSRARLDLDALSRHATLALRRIATETELRTREAAYRSLVEHASDAVIVVSRAFEIRFVSPVAAQLLRASPVDLLGTPLLAQIHPDHHAVAVSFLEALTDGQDAVAPVEWHMRGGDDNWLAVETTGSNLLDHPQIRGILLTSRDVSDRKALEQQLLRQAFHDPLTDLGNRMLFREQLAAELVRPLHRAVSHAVLFLDLDRFKLINDTLGHDVGDQLLQAIAGRLQASVRVDDLVARLGGDEFAILLYDIIDDVPAIQIAERILEVMEEPIHLAGHRLFVSTSIGIALGSSLRDQPEDMIRRADIAMYQAKRQGRACYAVYDEQLDRHAIERLDLETELRGAVKRRQIEVHYQPLISLDTGHVEEVEALVRWHHPERGLLAPVEFISVAEETGLIVPIGQYVLEESCRQVREWQETLGGASLRLSVNLSARQFQQPGLVDDVARALRLSGLNPGDLTLEITESAAMADVEMTGQMLTNLRQLGVHIALDDFGIGYSALNTLKQFPVDRLKIDRSFVEGLGMDKGDTAIVGAVIACAKALDLHVTAEGIESAQQVQFLRSLECQWAQGFLISAPLPQADLLPFLAKVDVTRRPVLLDPVDQAQPVSIAVPDLLDQTG